MTISKADSIDPIYAKHSSQKLIQVFKGYQGQAPEDAQFIFLGLYMVGSNLALALPNSRMQESEADKLGLIFMSMAGYDPTEAVPFWQRMAAVNKNKLPQFLSTHPSDETRIRKLTEMIPEIKSAWYKP